MKYAVAITVLLLTSLPISAGHKNLPPFAQSLQDSQVVDILFWSNSNQTQYLGFDWIDSYCFGRVLGCAVTDQPATAQYSYGEIVFRAGDWLIYATCFGDGPAMQIQMLAPCWTPNARAQVSPQKNMRTLVVGNPGDKPHRWRGHTYTAVSAFNTETKDVWGQGTPDDWRTAVAAMEITKELKNMPIDDQLTWSGKIAGLRAAGLMTADNLEKVAAEIKTAESVSAQPQK
jgi:hypothetical protein